jgi:hypothetical protein
LLGGVVRGKRLWIPYAPTANITRSEDPRKDDVLREKLSGLGETAFSLGTLDIELPDHAFVPPSALKKAGLELRVRSMRFRRYGLSLE